MAGFICECGKEFSSQRGLGMHQSLYCPLKKEKPESLSEPLIEEKIDETLPPPDEGPSLPFGISPEMLSQYAPAAKEILGISTIEKAVSLMLTRIEEQTAQIEKQRQTVDSLVQLANQAMGKATSAPGSANASNDSGGGVTIGQNVNRMLNQATIGDIGNLIKTFKGSSEADDLLGNALKYAELGKKFADVYSRPMEEARLNAYREITETLKLFRAAGASAEEATELLTRKEGLVE